MREAIHPDYVESKVHCSCGNTFVTRSTKPELHVELCNKCHPFYTGQQKFVDTGGRVQRFADKFGGAAETVMQKEAAVREARQKAHEDAVIAAKNARDAKEAVEAEKARKAALRAPKAEAAPAEESAAEVVAESAEAGGEPAAEAVAVAEDVVADEPVVEDAPAEDAPVEDAPAEETAPEESAE
jgi:large subunit ribosomal protein L31